MQYSPHSSRFILCKLFYFMDFPISCIVDNNLAEFVTVLLHVLMRLWEVPNCLPIIITTLLNYFFEIIRLKSLLYCDFNKFVLFLVMFIKLSFDCHSLPFSLLLQKINILLTKQGYVNFWIVSNYALYYNGYGNWMEIALLSLVFTNPQNII